MLNTNTLGARVLDLSLLGLTSPAPMINAHLDVSGNPPTALQVLPTLPESLTILEADEGTVQLDGLNRLKRETQSRLGLETAKEAVIQALESPPR